MVAVAWLAGILFAVYVAACGYMAAKQRAFLYFPDKRLISPAAAHFSRACSITLDTSDGERLVAWFVAARDPTKPLLLYLHGNAGNLADKALLFDALTADGAGLLAIDYRGFGGSTGAPTEAGLHRDADAAYAEALRRGYPPSRIVLIGESLGTGVAVALAAKAEVKALVLEAAYSAVADIAASRYRFLPVLLLMRDAFRADRNVGLINAPILFVHGAEDRIIPIRFGRLLFQRANQPKTFITVEQGGHQVLRLHTIMAEVMAWIAACH